MGAYDQETGVMPDETGNLPVTTTAADTVPVTMFGTTELIEGLDADGSEQHKACLAELKHRKTIYQEVENLGVTVCALQPENIRMKNLGFILCDDPECPMPKTETDLGYWEGIASQEANDKVDSAYTDIVNAFRCGGESGNLGKDLLRWHVAEAARLLEKVGA